MIYLVFIRVHLWLKLVFLFVYWSTIAIIVLS